MSTTPTAAGNTAAAKASTATTTGLMMHLTSDDDVRELRGVATHLPDDAADHDGPHLPADLASVLTEEPVDVALHERVAL